MANNYRIMTGAKLSYSPKDSGTYTQIIGLNSIPDLLGEPDTVESTTFDNLKYRSYVPGLQDIGTLSFGFNLEDPSATANIKVIYDLANASGDPAYFWKLEYVNGITAKFKSKCRYSLPGGSPNDLSQFNLILMPEDEITITLPASV